MITNRQLFTPIKELELFSHYSLCRLVKKNGNNMPHIEWPDGKPCLLANLYMLSLRERKGRGGRQGLSRRGSKGGTMGAYAAKISQLIRYCFNNNFDLIDLSDSKFSLFISTLRAERADFNPETKKKTELTVTAVGRVCLDFLCFIGRFYGDETFVAEEGTIRATKREMKIKSKDGKVIMMVPYWHHHSFTEGDRLKKRTKISKENVIKLRDAVWEEGSRFIQSRRLCLLSLLERTGARRGELAELRVSDVFAADSMAEPMLKIPTLKQGDEKYRLVPVHKQMLSELKKYIRMYRRSIIKGTIGSDKDHDFFFVSETTGKPLTPDTLTSEISTLRKIANISEQACAHMFRHAFITNLFVILIERHKFETSDDFRLALLGSETFKQEVMQWTGQKSSAVIDNYLHLAYAEIAGYSKTIATVHLIYAMEQFDQKLMELTSQLGHGMQIAEYREELSQLLKLRDEDFIIAQRRESEI